MMYKERDMGFSMITTELYKASVDIKLLGFMDDLNMGRGNVKCSLSSDDLEYFINSVDKCIVDKADKDKNSYKTYCCVDGRKSKYDACGRQAGGNLSYILSGVLAESSVLKNDNEVSFKDMLQVLIEHGYRTIGLMPSSHTNDCAAANHLGTHIDSIINGEVNIASESTLNLIEEYLKRSYGNIVEQPADLSGIFSSENLHEIRNRAIATKAKLVKEKWSGSEYTEYVAKTNNQGIELLEETEHCEQSIILFFGKGKTISKAKLEELGLPEAFVITVDDCIETALSLMGQSGLKGFKKALTANICFQLAVANNVVDKNMPVIAIYA